MTGIHYKAQISMEAPPTEDEHVMRKIDAETLFSLFWGEDAPFTGLGAPLEWGVA